MLSTQTEDCDKLSDKWRRVSEMKSSKLGFLMVSLVVIFSMILSGCGAEATPTPVPPAATDTPAAPAATDTPVAPAATDTPGAAMTGEIIKIAVDLPVSGGDASVGIPTRNGMQLAIDQANAKGGVTLDGKTYKLQM